VPATPPAARCPAAGWRAEATIAVGRFPFGVAVDTRTDIICAASDGTGTGAGSVSVIDGRTRTVAATVAGRPRFRRPRGWSRYVSRLVRCH